MNKYCILLLPLLVIHYNCDDTTELKSQSAEVSHRDAIKTQIDSCKTIEHNIISFNNGENISVCTSVPTNRNIDSIAISRNKIEGVFIRLNRNKFPLGSFKILQKTNPREYDKLSSLCNTFLVTSGNTQFRFWGTSIVDENINQFNRPTAIISLYSLYSNSKHICNILTIDSLSPSSEKDFGKLLIFTDGETLTVSTNYHTEKPIDSISTSLNSFTGRVIGWGKGVLPLNNFEFLKAHNPDEFQAIDSITTAYSIKSNGNDFYFNGKSQIGFKIPIGSEVKIDALLLSLFSQKKHLSYVLIINAMKQVD